MDLFPLPQKTEPREGSLEVAGPIPARIQFEATRQFKNALETFAPVFFTTTESSVAKIELHKTESIVNEEGYRLTIHPEKAIAESRSEMGMFRALVTFSQIHREYGHALPCLAIEDYPDLPVRGFMLDISRCRVPTQESLFDLIDQLAKLKYNQLQLYTEHTFAYKDHSEVWRDASPLTPEEIRALDSYCHDRYIELVPNQNSFGHMERWLRHDAYKRLAECPQGYEHPILGRLPWGGTLKPNQESIDFVSGLYDELLPNFGSKQLNIGGDEPWELGQGWSKARVAEEGKHPVYLEHLLAIERQVAQRGRRMQFWGDIILESPELARSIPDEAIGIIWGYEANHPFANQCAAYARSGKPFYVAPGTSNWNSIGGRYDNMRVNIETAIQEATKSGAEGMLLTCWGDFGHHHFLSTAYPGLIWGSALSWNRSSKNSVNDIHAINTFFLNSDDQTIATLLVRLANAQRPISRAPHNRTVLNDILFATAESLPEESAKTNSSELHETLSELSEIKTELSERDSMNEHAARVSREIGLAADLLAFAARKGLRAIGEDMAHEESLHSIAARYRALWLESNRPGGLDESADYFARAGD